MITENIRCLRDPDCYRHLWHGGHIQVIGPIDPRKLYQARQRNRDAGRRAWCLVRRMEDKKSEWGPKLTLSRAQRLTFFREIQIELLGTHLLPIGGEA